MEVASTVISLLSTLQIVDRALKDQDLSHDPERNRVLAKYSLLASIAKECADVVQNSLETLTRSPPLIEALEQCIEIGAEVASRFDKKFTVQRNEEGRQRKFIEYRLASWMTLERLLDEFHGRVMLLHSLTQDLLLRNLFESQTDIHRDVVFSEVDAVTKSRHKMDGASFMTRQTAFTVRPETISDVVTLADEVVMRSISNGVHFGADPSLTFGTVTMIHESEPHFVPVRVKYDTGADVNFIPASLVEKHRLSSHLIEIEKDEDVDGAVFIGLNNQEYIIKYTVTLHWCAANMHRMRTTEFHVAEDLPYDMLLGNSFIQENQVFHPQRIALPLRRKHRSSEQRKEEEHRKQAHAQIAAEESQRERNEDAIRRALEREARRIARTQTSASSMNLPTSTSNFTPPQQGTSSVPPLSGPNNVAMSAATSQPSLSVIQTSTSSTQDGASGATASSTETGAQVAADCASST